MVLIPTFCFGQWTQLGNDIDGVQVNEISGTAISLNGDGKTVAIGAPNNNTNGTTSGQARIFEWNATSWVQKGNFITGSVAGSRTGGSISLNDNGNVVIIGSPGSSVNSTIDGYAEVYEWTGTTWNQRGSTFNGINSNDSYGTTVSVNVIGDIVAIAAEPFSTASYVRVFQWNGTTWNQMGSDITTGIAEDGFGRSMKLNASGTIIAIGCENFDNATNNIGRVKVYEWNGTSWIQKGSDLLGDVVDDFFGTGVSINDNGTIVSAGARSSQDLSAGYVKIFEWNGSNYIQKGINIVGNDADFYGTSTDLNSLGDKIIVGTILGDYADILEWNGTEWIQVDSLIAEVAGDQFGRVVSMNNSGSSVAVGAAGNDTEGSQSGHVRVFENSAILSIENVKPLNQFSAYPNPTNGKIKIIGKDIIDSYDIISIEGKILKSIKHNQQGELLIDLSVFNVGVYFINIKSNKNSNSFKIIKK